MNSFERFSFSAEPLLDRQALKARYLEEAERLHPDRIQKGQESREEAGDQLAALNAAFETLDSPRLRLALLGELMTGKAPARTGRVSGPAADLMMKIAGVCQKIDGLLDRHSRAEGVLEAAMLSGDIFEATEAVSAVREEVDAWEQRLELELEQLQKEWEKGVRDPVALEKLYQFFSYSEKARKQLEEKFLKLAGCLG